MKTYVCDRRITVSRDEVVQIVVEHLRQFTGIPAETLNEFFDPKGLELAVQGLRIEWSVDETERHFKEPYPTCERP